MGVPKDENFKERSKIVNELCSKLDDSLEEVRKEVLRDLCHSIQKLKSHIDSDDERVSLDAIKYHSKLAGLEIDRVENSGNIFITTEREKKILEAATL